MESNKNTSGVSVIICCYNSATRLPETLKHLALQEVADNIPWEVIIVDNASTDTTQEIAQNEWDKYNLANVGFKIIEQPIPGLSHAREKGVEEAKYGYIIFCDDDNWLNNFYVHTVFEIFKSDLLIGVIGGQSIPFFEFKKPIWFDKFQETFAVGVQNNKTCDITNNRGWLWGAGMGLRKDVFQTLRKIGFKFSLLDRQGGKLTSGHDVEICQVYRLLGFKLFYSERLILYHYMPKQRMNWAYVLQLNKFNGIGTLKIMPYELFIKKNSYSKFLWIKNSIIYLFSLAWNSKYYFFHLIRHKEGDEFTLAIYRRLSYIKNYIYHPFYINKKLRSLNELKRRFDSTYKPSMSIND